MTQALVLSPRYHLDDPSIWLEGIDPARRYWIRINGEQEAQTVIPGLVVSSIEEWKQAIRRFRNLQPREKLLLKRAATECLIYCVSPNCYGLEAELNGFLVWHLFDQETMESLLMTSHPDWQCAPQDMELGRKALNRSFRQTIAA